MRGDMIGDPPVESALPTQPSILAPLAQVLSDFTRGLTGSLTVEQLLARLATATADLLEVDGCAVIVVESGWTRLVHASDPATEAAESAQSRIGGPGQSSHRQRAPVVLQDLTRPTRWPEFATATVAVGFHAVASIPLVGRDRSWAVLDLYRREPGPFDPEVLSAAQSLAEVATAHLLMADDRDRAATALGEMSYRALHDPLTGLANRALFFDRAEHALAARRRHRGPVVMIFADLDGFKGVNDTLGHAAGDLLLQEVGRRFSAVVRAEDTVARLGGDEFAILSTPAPDGTGTEGVASGGVPGWAARTVERLAASLMSPVQLMGSSIHVRASIGMALAGPGQECAADLVHAADVAMYRSKPRDLRAGRARDHLDHSDQHARSQLIDELRRAAAPGGGAERDPFHVVYQPVVELNGAGGRRPRRQLEALLRWTHPTRGELSPGSFLRVAEDTELIVGIGATVLRRACLLARDWQDVDFESSVSVNISPTELRHPGFVARVADALRRADIDSRWLRLEVTEQSLLETGDRVATTMAELQELGVGLSLDDFGSGLSSITQLDRFPIDAVKLDRSWMTRLDEGSGAAVIGGIRSLTRALGLEAVAEGVETEAQLAELQGLGFDHAQGFLLGRPAERSGPRPGPRPAEGGGPR